MRGSVGLVLYYIWMLSVGLQAKLNHLNDTTVCVMSIF